jgi:hypothetical protein
LGGKRFLTDIGVFLASPFCCLWGFCKEGNGTVVVIAALRAMYGTVSARPACFLERNEVMINEH